MKLSRKFLVTAALLTAAVVSFAQSTTSYTSPASSLLNEKTAGLFENEFDRQFTANMDFGTYNQQFLYGGLGNPRKTDALLTSAPTLHNVMFGYYRPAAEHPWSIVGDWGAEGTFPDRPGSTSYTDSGVTTTNTPLGIFLFKKYTTDLQFLTKVGGSNNMVIGGQFFLYSDFSNLNPNFFHKRQVKGGSNPGTEQVWNFNSGLGNITNPLYTPLESAHNFEIGVPIALRMGNIEYSARIFINSNIKDRNGSYKSDIGGTDVERKITDMDAYTKFGVDCSASIPVRDKEEDRWIIGGDFNFGLATASKKQTVKNIAALFNTRTQYKPHAGGGFTLRAQRLFNFHPADSIAFRIRPGVSFGYAGAHNAGFTGSNMDNPAASVYKTTIGSTTTTMDDPKQWKSAHQVTTGFELPMGITIKPEKWICGFVLGATPSISFATNVAYAEVATPSLATPLGSRTITVVNPVFAETHVVGLTFDFAGDVHLDVYATGNLTELDQFTAQVFIPLGEPKAKAPKAAK